MGTPIIRPVFSLTLGASLAWALLPADAARAEPQDSRIRCESKDGHWNHCKAQGEVELLRQISRNPCIRNHSWGRDDTGVWVSRGCRAEFGVQRPAGASAGEGRVWRTLRCESRNSGFRHCTADTSGGVRLTRQLSGMDCELGRTWGHDDDGVWVARGCRAEFQILEQARPSSSFLRKLFRRGPEAAVATPQGSPLRCESIDGKRRECRVQGATSVELVRQLSRANCVAGTNWGWREDRVWVEQGCRAEFTVWSAAGN